MPKWDVRERDNRKSDDRERGHILNTDCIKKECSKIDKNRERIKGVILKNQNNSTYFSPNFDYISVIKHYFTKYKERIGKEHPVLTIDRWEEVIDALPVIFDDDMSRSEDIDEEQLMTIINQHFNTEYRDCDYNILHFMAGDIRKNRFYEVVY